ncbi:zinc finger MYM-type protein 1-like protein [Tanacetum coccineum]
MFFYILEKLITLVSVCWKESEISTESRFQKLAQVFEDLEVEIREGSDEKSSCGPHYKSVLKAIDSYDKILDMMANVILRQDIHRSYLSTVDRDVFSFGFVFMLHLTKALLGVSSELNIALLKKDQDIVNDVGPFLTDL